MTDAFAQLIDPVIQGVLGVIHDVRAVADPEPAKVKTDLRAAFETAQAKANASAQLAADYALARYGLVYWADEMLITSAWAHADAWRNQMLEWDYYRENLAGEKFFEKADQAARLSGTDALETFFLCVALGFQGRYALDQPALRAWSDSAYQKIAGQAQQGGRFLAEDDLPRGPLEPLPGTSLLWKLSVLTSASVLVSVLALIVVYGLAR